MWEEHIELFFNSQRPVMRKKGQCFTEYKWDVSSKENVKRDRRRNEL